MRDKTYDTAILRNFFGVSVAFFSKDVPREEARFKSEFHDAHSDWISLKRSDLQTFHIKPSLFKPLEELFEKARLYFRAIVGSQETYQIATRVNAQKWAELQVLAKAILKECGY